MPSPTITTPLMNLVLPVPGTQVGPTWADNLNAALQLVDSHDHTSGKGTPVPTAGLNINADLTFNNLNALALRSTRYQIQGAPLTAAADKNCISSVNGELYWNDNAGNQVQLTASGGLNAASIGGIGGDYTGSGASVSYSSLTKVYSFLQAAGIPAKMFSSDLSIAQAVALANTITLKSPNSLASSYSLVLPTALPGSTSFTAIDSSGNMSNVTPDNSTIEISGSTARVKDAGITQAKLAADVLPAGMVIAWAGTSAPTGWLLCDGSAVSRTTYANLFALMGVTHGQGDGSTTFNLPDYRGQFLRGYIALSSIAGSGTAASNNATFTAHGVNRTGMKVRLASGTLSGLSTLTDYYAIVVDANTLAFATSKANALAGTKITITGANSAVITQYEDPDASSRTAMNVGGTTSGPGSMQTDNLKAHSHGTYAGSSNVVGGAFNFVTSSTSDSGLVTSSVNPSGNETRPVNAYVNYLVKY